MKLEPNMYVRTLNGIIKIDKIISGIIKDTKGYLFYGDIIKASFDIIELIEVGDYVNGYKVDFVQNGYVVFNHNHPYQINIYPKDIKSIVTKEQFEAMAYKVGD